MTDAVILTVHDRPLLTLSNTLSALAKNDLTDTVVLVVDDGSTVDYADFWRQFDGWPIEHLRCDTIAERPETYHIGGHNNPVWVNNRALEYLETLPDIDRLFWLSSDVILPPHALERARRWDLGRYVYCGTSLDIDSGTVFCAPDKPWPMMWFVGTTLENCKAIGGFDLAYLRGMGFEDNDFMGRLALHAGGLVIDGHTLVFHQSHVQTAYSDNWEGFKRSEEYTVAKWGAVPWRQADVPFGYDAKFSDGISVLTMKPAKAQAGARPMLRPVEAHA